MNERTQTQSDEESRRSAQLSRQRRRPPTEVPGHETERFLGAGAYGEVWVALDRNTGRRVAIKFFAHRGGLDWSRLSREVEKLVRLSADRYVVQLLEVGWKSEPPYYVMEYLERGSLDDRLCEEGTLPVSEALSLFREVAIGLAHAHGRGVLHCDLKPANVLLDQDQRPRLADFGQSRLSHEQKPALGTLFYMAPEQADLSAVPDARWDVYALGALLYTMLTGTPPFRTESRVAQIERAPTLEARLARYRQIISSSPPPAAHREAADVDRTLVDLIDRCLAVDPEKRFPSVQSVLDALEEREARRTRRPLVVLGMIGPVVLLLLMGLAAWRGVETVVRQTDEALTRSALERNRFAAQYAARAAGGDLVRRFRAVEDIAHDDQFRTALSALLADDQLSRLRTSLNDPTINPTRADDEVDDETLDLREEFRRHPARHALQARLETLLSDPRQPGAASWFVNDAHGLQIARSPDSATIGQNYGWRTYFHGGPEDRAFDWRPGTSDHLTATRLSAVFLSQATGKWILGISTPILDNDGAFLGVLALTVEVGGGDFGVRLSETEAEENPEQLAVLVDWRDGPNKGLIIQHPLFKEIDKLTPRFENYRIDAAALPNGKAHSDGEPLRHGQASHPSTAHYRDPLAGDESGRNYAGRWLAESAPVRIRGDDSHLRVIVQARHEHAIAPLNKLKHSLQTIGLLALAGVAIVLTVLWAFVMRGLNPRKRSDSQHLILTETTPAETMATIAYQDDENR